MSSTSAGRGTDNRQARSRYFFPSDRSLAPSHAMRNQGWFASCTMNCCPTMPVAPRMPTSTLLRETTVTSPQCGASAPAASLGDPRPAPLRGPLGKKKPAGWLGRRVAEARFDLLFTRRAHTHHRPREFRSSEPAFGWSVWWSPGTTSEEYKPFAREFEAELDRRVGHQGLAEGAAGGIAAGACGSVTEKERNLDRHEAG